MALEKEIMTDVGIPANFWLVAKVDIDKVAEQALITMYGYMNKEHSDANKGYLSRIFINVYPEEFREAFALDDLNNKNPYEISYGIVKTREMFLGAKDVIFDENGNLISDE
jgi:hypothetical protein